MSPDPEPEEPEEELEDTDTDEEDLEREVEAIAEEQIREVYAGEEAEIREARDRIDEIMAELDLEADVNVQIDSMDSSYDESGISDQEATFEVRELRRRVREYQRDELARQDRKARCWARVKGFAVLVGIAASATAVAAFIYEMIEVNKAPADKDIPGLTKEQRELLTKQVQRWQNLSDAEAWQMMAGYCDKWNPSWQAQLFLMDLFKKLAVPLKATWVWRGRDVLDRVEALEDAYAKFQPLKEQRKSRILYVSVSKETYDGFKEGDIVNLPRQVAADLAMLAITEIVIRHKLEKPVQPV